MEIPPPPGAPPPWPPPAPPPLPASAQRKKRVLAQWALLPLIPFLIVHCIWGLPEARQKAGEGAIPFLALQIVGGLFVSLLIAWISYRMSSRSQSVGSIVFTAFILIFTLNAIAPVCGFYFNLGPPPQTQQSGRRPMTFVPQPPQTEFPEFGFHVDSPPGWQQCHVREFPDITSWVSSDSGEQGVRALISIRWEEVGANNLLQRAQHFAQIWGGRIDEQRIFLDGEPTWRIYAHASETELKPVEAFITRRGGRIFVIMGGIFPGHTCHVEMESIRKSWKWMESKEN
jgi:hypothetical protein